MNSINTAQIFAYLNNMFPAGTVSGTIEFYMRMNACSVRREYSLKYRGYLVKTLVNKYEMVVLDLIGPDTYAHTDKIPRISSDL